jgi:hypothetical protein
MASVRTTVMKMKHDASRLSPLVERVPSDVHLLLFDRLGSPRVLYPLLNLTEDESGSEPTCCPQPQRPVKECLGSTFNVSEEENRGIHLFRLLVSNPSLFVRAHDRGTRAREDTTFSFSIAGLDIGGCCEDHRETQIPSDRTCDVDRIRSTAHIIKKKTTKLDVLDIRQSNTTTTTRRSRRNQQRCSAIPACYCQDPGRCNMSLLISIGAEVASRSEIE